ncbi:protein takeout-like [Bactrocera neohumeralis]|uniref:protein takeout-like n=1 Tax=Bactrocera neohumeralis TaxID=98809 RepID=UPI0021653327|nr:protein takeout-like [Bactrocera neohumeralis]
MSRISWIPLFACAVLYMQSATAQKALDFERCRYGDSVCHTKITNELIKKYGATGVRALHIPPFDPLRIKSLVLPPNPKALINARLSFTNVDITGLTNAQNIKVEGFTRDVTSPISLSCTVPKARFSGAYEGEGKILGANFQGKGNCVIELSDITLTCKIDAKLVQKSGKNYLVINNVSLVMSKPKNVRYQLDGLYHGNPELSATANDFLNGNADEIFEGMRPNMQEVFAVVVHEYMTKCFNEWPYDDLFLPE